MSAPTVDPEVLEDLTTVEAARKLFDSLGKPMEFWEALCLLKMQPDELREEVRRLTDLLEAGHAVGIARVVLDRLKGLREAIGPLVAAVREFLPRVPDMPADPEAVEMLLGFIAISPKGREAASRWTSDPARYATEAGGKVRSIAGVAEGYIAEIRRRRPAAAPLEDAQFAAEDPPIADTPPAPAGPPPGMESAAFEKTGVPVAVDDPFSPLTPRPAHSPLAAPRPAAPPKPKPQPAPERAAPSGLPPGVDPAVLDDVRHVEQCRKIFEVTHQQIEAWEVFCLVMLEQDTKSKMAQITAHRNNGETDSFMDGALALFEKLLDMRSKYGRFVRKLREYIATLPVGHFGKDTMEMALGFIVVSARGRTRAQQWLDEPERSKPEAAGRLEDIISRTINYQTALRQLPPP